MEKNQILELIKKTESPLRKQLLMVGLMTALLEERGKDAPIVIGGCALSYYTREVYFTADIDLAYADREALDSVLTEIGFFKKGRYWVNENFDLAVEVPVGILAGEDAPVEVVDLGAGLSCRIIGIEDLIIDRLNACKHWKSRTDCEMSELLIKIYSQELDWNYLEKKAALPENETSEELLSFKTKANK